jgi:rieske iron-sulfur protein
MTGTAADSREPSGQARRRIVKAGLCLGLGLPLSGPVGRPALAQDTSRNARPREGDRLVFASGERGGQPIAPSDVRAEEPGVLAYPMDPRTGITKDGSRLNQILLLRLVREELAEATRAQAADGIVAYSAVCTHAGCDIQWLSSGRKLRCPCHESEFDANDGGRVLGGPAPRRLPTLPIRVVDGTLNVAGAFSGRVGFQAGGG